MKIHPGVRFDTEKGRDGASLTFTALADSTIDEVVTVLARVDFSTLFELAAVPEALAASLQNGACFSNGWQSWSFSGELGPRETVPRTRLRSMLNTYTDRPGPLARRGAFLSHFITYFRSEQSYLVLVSRGLNEVPGPPVTFRIDRTRRQIDIEILAQGARLQQGKPLVHLELFLTEGYFKTKDRLRSIFSGYGHFDRLSFLGHGNSLVPGGYETWYNRYSDIDDEGMVRDIAAIGANDNFVNDYYLKRGKPTVFQIDDGWERSIGDWDPDPKKFPRGMKVLAQEIEQRGMIPGIWIAPFILTRSSTLFREHPEWVLRNERGIPVAAGLNPGWGGIFHALDLSIPAVEEHVSSCFDRLVEEWGYRYLKLDFLYAGFLQGKRQTAGAAFEQYDKIMRRIASRIVNAAGRPVAYLGCGAPLEPSFRHFPLMRIGADTRESWDWPALRMLNYPGRPSARVNLGHTIARALLDGTVFVNDPDVLFFRTDRMALSETEKELVALLDCMLGSQMMFSDAPADFGKPVEAAFTARIIGLFDRLAGRRFGVRQIGRDLFRLFSEDGAIEGVVNLSDRPRKTGGFDRERPILSHARIDGDILVAEPHSISLFEE